MTIRDELVELIAEAKERDEGFAAYTFLRDHGPALVEALDGWQRMTEEARRIQHRHLDNHGGDVYHAVQSLASKYGCRDRGQLIVARGES